MKQQTTIEKISLLPNVSYGYVHIKLNQDIICFHGNLLGSYDTCVGNGLTCAERARNLSYF
jgi:hypothetical protein